MGTGTRGTLPRGRVPRVPVPNPGTLGMWRTMSLLSSVSLSVAAGEVRFRYGMPMLGD